LHRQRNKAHSLTNNTTIVCSFFFFFRSNGNIGGFKSIRRSLIHLLSDELFDSITGTTDSEAAFALYLQHLTELSAAEKAAKRRASTKHTHWKSKAKTRAHANNDNDNGNGDEQSVTQTNEQQSEEHSGVGVGVGVADALFTASPALLLRAMAMTVATLTRLLNEQGITDPSLLNFCVSDGETLVVRSVTCFFAIPVSLQYYRISIHSSTHSSTHSHAHTHTHTHMHTHTNAHYRRRGMR
jgi:hypothetical protein